MVCPALTYEHFASVEAQQKSADWRNANGNVSQYLDSSGTIAAKYEYSPDPHFTVKSGAMADELAECASFSTKPWDEDLDAFRYELRILKDSRWMSRDRLGERGGVNLYVFVFNNINYYYDYLGREPKAFIEWEWYFDPDTGMMRRREKKPSSEEIKKHQQSEYNKLITESISRLEKSTGSGFPCCCFTFSLVYKIHKHRHCKSMPEGDIANVVFTTDTTIYVSLKRSDYECCKDIPSMVVCLYTDEDNEPVKKIYFPDYDYKERHKIGLLPVGDGVIHKEPWRVLIDTDFAPNSKIHVSWFARSQKCNSHLITVK